MEREAKCKIVIVGCGNLAWHLAKQLSSLKNYDVFVYNHQPNTLLNRFKLKLKCSVTPSLNTIVSDANFYFICVTDKVVATIAKKIKPKKKEAIILHTSGSLEIEALGNNTNTAVFYPLQTFSASDDVNWDEIPILIETKNVAVKKTITNLAKQFSKHLLYLNYQQRLHIHLAAVFVNNFTNALYVAATEVIEKTPTKQDFRILLPLIKQTISKVENLGAFKSQTGPAKRKDALVMSKHLALLSQGKDLKNIYKAISQLIKKQQKKQHA